MNGFRRVPPIIRKKTREKARSEREKSRVAFEKRIERMASNVSEESTRLALSVVNGPTKELHYTGDLPGAEGAQNAKVTVFLNGLNPRVPSGISRPVVLVRINDKKNLLFYKSSGRNSKMPGEWLPFSNFVMNKFLKLPGHPKFGSFHTQLGEKIKQMASKGKINFTDLTSDSTLSHQVIQLLSLSDLSEHNS